jgi:hypothetical protein
MRKDRSSLTKLAGRTPSNEEDLALMRRAAWRKQGVLVVSPSDSRLTWPEKEFIKQIAEKLYGGMESRHEE